MNLKSVNAHVAAYVKTNSLKGKEVTEEQRTALVIELLTGGASMSLVNREINKSLKAAGVTVPVREKGQSLKEVRKAVKEMKSVAKVTSYKDMRVIAEKVEEKLDCTFKAAIQVISAELKELKISVPRQCNIKGIKAIVLDYFVDTPKKERTLQGCATYIQEELVAAEEVKPTPDRAEKLAEEALTGARMNFTFADMISKGLSVSDVN